MGVKTTIAILALLVASTAFAQSQNQNQILPAGSEITVRTDSAIPAKPQPNATYSATVSGNVTNSSGAVVVPTGSRAELVALPSDDGKDTTLDLQSVTVNGQRYLLEANSQSTSSGSGSGLGINKRTGKYVGGGAAVGAVLGALLGGGKGAGIGAIVGGAGGAGAQVLTGRHKEIPAETQLKYKLAQDLQMRSAPAPSQSGGLQQRPTQ